MKKNQNHRPHRFFAPFFLAAVVFWPFFAPAPAWAEASLVDRLLSLLGNKNIPKIEIPAPAAPAPMVPPSVHQLEIAPSFLPVYAAGDEDTEIPPVIPFFASAAVNAPHPRITTLLIMIHGADREAARAFAHARSAQDEASARMPEWNAADAFLFAPQFLTPEDIAGHANRWPDKGDALLRWVGEGWVHGDDSVPPAAGGLRPRRAISSYAALDFALLLLARPRILPDLQKVVIAGSGAGGDFVQRYSVLGIAPDILSGEGIEVRFVPAQARSYLYLDAFRVSSRAGEKDPITRESLPEFAPVDTKTCEGGNTYPYGLDKMPPYATRQGVNEVRLRYAARQVVVMAGAGATLPLTDSTPAACALKLQGADTAARAKNYFAALTRLYGGELDRMQRLYLVSGLNEDSLVLWRSRCGMAALFGDGGCAADDVGGKAMRILEKTN